jgi:glycosyltransferase involved in cell wall biosynthesis
MKITHLTSVHPPDDNRIFKICRSVARTGRTVSYVVPAEKDHSVDGVAIKSVPVLSSRILRMLLTTWRVYWRAVEERADIYQFHDPELIPVGLALRLLQNRKVVYDVHENVPDQILSKRYIPRPLRKLTARAFDWFERHAAARFSAIVTANEDISERFNRANDHVVAIHNYAEAREFAGTPENNEARYASGVVFHSAASERTAFPAVVQAIELLSKKISVRLIVTGVTDSEAREAAGLARRSCCPQIEVVGLLSREEMARAYLESAVSLVFYNQPRNHSSIRANRFFEALAAAAPVIVSDFPEWRAAVESISCGLAVDPEDPTAIAAAIEYVLTHPEEAAAMGKRGRHAFLTEFTWEQECNKLLRFYDWLVVGNQQPAQEVAAIIS